MAERNPYNWRGMIPIDSVSIPGEFTAQMVGGAVPAAKSKRRNIESLRPPGTFSRKGSVITDFQKLFIIKSFWGCRKGLAAPTY